MTDGRTNVDVDVATEVDVRGESRTSADDGTTPNADVEAERRAGVDEGRGLMTVAKAIIDGGADGAGADPDHVPDGLVAAIEPREWAEDTGASAFDQAGVLGGWGIVDVAHEVPRGFDRVNRENDVVDLSPEASTTDDHQWLHGVLSLREGVRYRTATGAGP